ncbi:MAG: type II toxin-antitoxin system RelE/ParE family toxin [Polaromonas sp.]|uniref:type II toxin-antitoxin system RelE/ParE family toxin n=1 Tax=Polaromonas sp. TaxID=1869339 RepID=UPI002735CFF0|nr:type II toxin-antitoxin system RelE/ParE family toxin [Polaromonas sp.]MDP2820443.1 type II toxin-antitoxin system RelE/ParE family toxin [Polaromonas sp.]
MSYFFVEAARAEHLEHVAYYEERRPGLGGRYLAAFEAAMVKICENPERYRVELEPGIRRYRVPGFPYNILYRQSGNDIEVLVVAPHRRRPGYWLGRL